MDMSYIGERIRLRRKALNLTINQINEQTGISPGNISEIETGKKLPSSPALIALSNVLNCSIDWILKKEYSEEPKGNILLNEFEQSLIRELRCLSSYGQREIYEIIKLKNHMKDINYEQNLEILSPSQQETGTKLA